MIIVQQNLRNRKNVVVILLLLFLMISCKKEKVIEQQKPPGIDSLIVATPTINYFIPKYGVAGDYIKIFAKNLDYKNIIVKFDSLTGIVDRADSNSIIAQVPDYKQPGYCKISIKSGAKEILSKDSFFLFGPIIKSFSPESGKGMQHFIIHGENFSEIPWRNKVTIGGQIAEITKATTQQIEANISLNSLPITSFPIEITVNSITHSTPQKFNVLSPWTQLASLPVTAIAGGVTFEINNKIYYCTGRTSWLTANSFTQYVLEFDISKGQWSRKNDFPGTARNNAVCYTINGEAYVGLGTTSEYSTFASDFWKYNPENDHWTKISDFPGLPRKAGAAFAYNGKGYVMMGSGNNFYKDSWVYSPDTDKWDTLATFPDQGRNDLHVARQNNNVYIYYSTRQSFDSNQIWKFDLTENIWTYMGLFNNCAIVSFFDNNRSYFLADVNKFFQFLPDQNITIRKPNFPGIERAGFAETGVQIIVGNKIYFGAGSVGGYGQCINDFWSYDIE